MSPWKIVPRPDRYTIPIGRIHSDLAPIVVYGDEVLARRIVRLLNAHEKKILTDRKRRSK